jgi:hypothetical protein
MTLQVPTGAPRLRSELRGTTGSRLLSTWKNGSSAIGPAGRSLITSSELDHVIATGHGRGTQRMYDGNLVGPELEMALAVTRAIAIDHGDDTGTIEGSRALAALALNTALVMAGSPWTDDAQKRRRMLKDFMRQVDKHITGILNDPDIFGRVKMATQQ